jgi:hypothetical protein
MPELTKLQIDFLEKLRTQDLDLNGRKIINVGAAINDNDVITKAELMRILEDLGVI